MRRLADDRADDSDYPRMIQLAQSLAGEVWTDDDLTFWFREPVTPKRQPEAIATWVPTVTLPKPSGLDEAAPPRARRHGHGRGPRQR